ncbi:unnamed protein product, partial [Boreogadus saida]
MSCRKLWKHPVYLESCSRTGAALEQREAGPHPGGTTTTLRFTKQKQGYYIRFTKLSALIQQPG